MTGHESGIDIRRDDGTLDVSLNWIARNGEVHFTIEVNSMYGLAKTIVDFTPERSAKIGGAFKEAGRLAGQPVVPMSVLEARDRWSPQDVSDHGRLCRCERCTQIRAEGPRAWDGTRWSAQDVGHVLGERD